MSVEFGDDLSHNFGGHPGCLVCKVGTAVGMVDILQILKAPRVADFPITTGSLFSPAVITKNAHVSL